MNTFDETYINILKDIIDNGVEKYNERTKSKTLSVFNKQIISRGALYEIPLSNSRLIHWKGALIEIMWMMGLHRFDPQYKDLPLTNIKYLRDNGVRYWNPWADINGNLGRVYGAQLVDWNNTINQVEYLIDKLRTNPDDRRLVLTMWNPSELNDMILPPCHHTIEFYSEPQKNNHIRVLHTRWMQRSADVPIGVPYNILMYYFMNQIIARCTNHIPGNIYGLLGDCHVYANQIDEAKELIRRWDSGEIQKCHTPILGISKKLSEKEYSGERCELSDFALDGSDFHTVVYDPCPKLKIAVTI